MTAALLTYTGNPNQVAISTTGASSEVGITFLVQNNGKAPVSIAQIVLTLPQGDGSTDLMATGTSFDTGSVHSSNSSSWSLSPNGNQAILMPVSSQGYATLAVGDSLQFTLSAITINATGAGQTAQIGVLESIFNGGDGSAQVAVQKIQPGFYIADFYLDQYNVSAGAPVTVTWKVVGALSCEVEAKIIDVVGTRRARQGPGCGVGTANAACDGVISTGTDFADSHTCNVQGATVFTLTAKGKGQSGDVSLSSQLLVTVNEPAINFTGFPPTAMLGQSVGLHWMAADAGKLQIYIAPATGQPTIEDKTATPVGKENHVPQVDTTYNLYAFTNASDTDPARQASVPVVVYQPAWTKPPVVTQQTHPTYPGDSFVLDWTIVNVQSCRLDSSVAGFQPLSNLPLSGPQPVTVPDPGVPQANATFTLTGVMYGAQGDYSPQPFPITITNTPNLTRALAANPNAGTSGATITLTWAVDHADAGTITNNLPASTWSQPVDPASGSQAVTLPTTVMSVPITYTLTFTRQGGKYTTTTATTVQYNGQLSFQGTGYAGGASANYLDTLYLHHPDKAITKLGIAGNGEDGINAVFVWYGSNDAADYVIRAGWGWSAAPDATMDIGDGDYLASITAVFGSVQSQWPASGLAQLTLTSSQGKSISAGFVPSDARTQVLPAPSGQQIIALAWGMGSVVDDDSKVEALGDFGMFSCTLSYGH